jgi:PHD/YefM family antitoxin component YafN of YafNO toxin-antitoxin module
MNNILTIGEITRGGMAAIEEGVQRGPLDLVRRNTLAAVVLSEDEYRRLTHGKVAARGE